MQLSLESHPECFSSSSRFHFLKDPEPSKTTSHHNCAQHNSLWEHFTLKPQHKASKKTKPYSILLRYYEPDQGGTPKPLVLWNLQDLSSPTEPTKAYRTLSISICREGD